MNVLWLPVLEIYQQAFMRSSHVALSYRGPHRERGVNCHVTLASHQSALLVLASHQSAHTTGIRCRPEALSTCKIEPKGLI